MDEVNSARYIAFAGMRKIATGELAEVALQAKQTIEQGEDAPVLIFDDTTSVQVEVDFRGTAEEVLRRLPAITPPVTSDDTTAAPTTPTGPGRPKLGVVAREVTLLPRHWEWLNRQSGGASVALRKLVDQARREHAQEDRIRQAQEATYRFMSALAGDLPGYEEATRALYAKNRERFDEATANWPEDVREHTRQLAVAVFQEGAE